MNDVICAYSENIIKERRIFVLFCCLATLIPILSLFGVFKPSGELLGPWFQRSGAITVVFAIFAELKASKMIDILDGGDFAGPTWQTANQLYCRKVQIYFYFSVLLIVLGTVVWGYGDLIYMNITSP
jgi:hypothetical protein